MAAEFGGFDLDPCPWGYSDSWSGLATEWRGKVFLNPPYGREIGNWVRKAYESSKQGATVVCLLPSRTDTTWWHEYLMEATEIHFIRGRLHFNDAGPAPFPSAFVIFNDLVR